VQGALDDVFSPLVWKRGTLYVLDQRTLPAQTAWVPCSSLDDVLRVIDERRVCGSFATACAAAYGIVLAARARLAAGATAQVLRHFVEDEVARTRKAAPPFVPVFWALAQVRDAARVSVETADAAMVVDALEARARAIQAEDIARCQRIGAAGADLLADGHTVLTIGNHGALACGGWGTSLGVIRSAWRSARRVRAIVCESRPFLDGARLSAWELAREGLDVTVVPDGAAPGLLARREVSALLLGADRISPAGDVATDVGSYGAALAAAAAGVPVIVAAQASCIDATAPLVVTALAPELLRAAPSAPPLPERVAIASPSADIVPAALITAIVTEHGVHRAPYSASLPRAS
jgi:methylthioribose-1-phosphate isomerase